MFELEFNSKLTELVFSCILMFYLKKNKKGRKKLLAHPVSEQCFFLENCKNSKMDENDKNSRNPNISSSIVTLVFKVQ